MIQSRVCLWIAAMVLSATMLLLAQQPTSQSASAAVPTLVNFSGKLKDIKGKPLTGIVGVTFSFYKDSDGGAPLWMETQNVTPDMNGRYTVTLGATAGEGLPADVFANGEARWMGVQAQGQAEQPRVMLVSVPYALKAGDAQTLGGLPVSAFALAGTQSSQVFSTGGTTNIFAPPSAVNTASATGTGTTDFLPLWTSSTNLGTSIVFQAPSSNSIGIGTTAPAAKLDVNGGATIRGQLSLPFTGTATASLGFNSQPLDLLASAFNGGTAKAVPQHFRWQAEPVGNDTTSPSGKLNLLFASGTATPKETGLSISNKGIITFAPGQTMPTVTGNETVNGNFTATGSVSAASAKFTGSVNTGNETVTGNVNATGSISSATAAFSGNNSTQIVSIAQTGTGTSLMATSTGGFAVLGQSSAGVGVFAVGPTAVEGVSSAANGTGVLGFSSSSTGIAVHGVSSSTSGVAGVFENTAQGKILSGRSKGIEVFAMDGNGNVSTNGFVSANGGLFADSSNAFVSAGQFQNTQASGTGVQAVGGTAPTGSGQNGGNGAVATGGNGDLTNNGTNHTAGGAGIVAQGGSGITNDLGSGSAGPGGYFIGGTSPNCAGPCGGDGIFAESGGSGYAGNFLGDLHVTGAIFAGTKDFKIDHPQDPSNKYLVHASVESSEMMNIYTGNATLDATGTATVQLPGWFQAENADCRYELTPVGAAAPNLHIMTEIANNQFTIGGGQPGQKVSWQVTAVRQDAYAQAHPLQVEQEKAPTERGLYIYPELYGEPKEKRIGWSRKVELLERLAEMREKASTRSGLAPR